MGSDFCIVRVGMQVEERRRVPFPRHWIGKMSCGGRSSATERVKEAGTPNLVGQAMGQARERARSKHTFMCFEEEPLPQRLSASVDARGRVGTTRIRSLVALRFCGKKLQISDSKVNLQK